MEESKELELSSGQSLGHMPGDRWEFDETVTAVFSDMLARSIPQYRCMRDGVLNLGASLAPAGSSIVDLGCSRGDGLAPFVERLGSRHRYLGVDISPPMLAAARRRFRDEIASGLLAIEELDLRSAYPVVEAGLTLCVLSLQFTPMDGRQRILCDAHASTIPGGAFILVEKLSGSSALIDEMFVEIYHDLKMSSGYSAEEVERKRLALRGVLVPFTAQHNEQMLREAGFSQVDCFWRWMNFAGWVAIK